MDGSIYKLVDKFRGTYSIETFNLNGSKNKANKVIENGANFIGKGICHSIVFTEDKLCNFKPKDMSSNLFVRSLQLLKGDKKLHDVVAAMAHVNRNIAKWAPGNPQYEGKCKWTSSYNLLHKSCNACNFDEAQFWEDLYSFKDKK